MTITASVKVRDGIVLGTDSMVQISARLPDGKFAIIKSYSHSNKLFQIQSMPIGVMSWGIGNIGPRSIEGILREFSTNLDPSLSIKPNVEEVSSALFSFIKSIYDEAFSEAKPEQRPVLGFFIGGYTIESSFAEEFEFLLPQMNEMKRVRPKETFGASWRGIVLPFRRLYSGFDSRIPAELKSLGVDEKILDGVFNRGKWNLPFVYDGMPLQEAVNHASFILNTTIDTAKFEAGPAPTCGAPVQLAVITPDGNWVWVSRPNLVQGEV